MGIVSCNVFVRAFGSLVSTYRFFSVYISVVCSGNVPPLVSAIQSVRVRRPIGLRSPPNQIASAAQSDCVRFAMAKYQQLPR